MTSPVSKFPSEADLAALRAAHGELELLEVVDPEGGAVDFAVIARRPRRPDYDAFLNAVSEPRTIGEARATFVIACAVWPPIGDIQAGIGSLPASAEMLANQLDDMASGGVFRLTPLDRLSEEQLANLDAAGVTAAIVDTLRAKYPGRGQLASAFTACGPFIVKRPTRSVYNEAARRFAAKDDIAGALFNLSLDCVVWPETTTAAQPVRDAAAAFPGVPSGW